MIEWEKWWKNTISILRTNWFLVALGVSIIFANLWPEFGKKNGIIRAEITISFVAIGLLFFVTGINMKTKTIVESFLYYKLIFLVQSISFLFTPAIGFAVASILKVSGFNSSLASGIVIACCCPTTVSSNVVLTVAANGNEAAAVANSIIGNTIGIFISPLLIIWLLGISVGGGVDYLKIFGNLGIIVVGPLVLGQLVRFMLPKQIEILKKYINLALFNSCCLLLIIYSVFCDTFSSGAFREIDAWLFVLVLFIMLVLLAFFSGASFYASRVPLLQFTKKDSISILFCASQKTVALGIPLIKVIFEGRTDIGVLSIPILVYHAQQLVFGAILVPYLLKWCPRQDMIENSEHNQIESENLELNDLNDSRVALVVAK